MKVDLHNRETDLHNWETIEELAAWEALNDRFESLKPFGRDPVVYYRRTGTVSAKPPFTRRPLIELVRDHVRPCV